MTAPRNLRLTPPGYNLPPHSRLPAGVLRPVPVLRRAQQICPFVRPPGRRFNVDFSSGQHHPFPESPMSCIHVPFGPADDPGTQTAHTTHQPDQPAQSIRLNIKSQKKRLRSLPFTKRGQYLRASSAETVYPRVHQTVATSTARQVPRRARERSRTIPSP